ncbi:50S ribosomal protein L31 type B [Muribaculaceae bacterium]|jgi:large subunit ribosomal protein L31|nr:50S ribosomal protein L31 type B [Muribaculaceae bacterium]
MISKDFVISKKSINFASHLTGSRPVKNFFNKLTAVFKEMKKDIHPKEYREVVFKDMSNDETFITRSTVASRETIEIDGKEYPLVKLEITSSSHPFFTGKQKLVDTAGRVDKFRSRYGNRSKK